MLLFLTCSIVGMNPIKKEKISVFIIGWLLIGNYFIFINPHVKKAYNEMRGLIIMIFIRLSYLYIIENYRNQNDKSFYGFVGIYDCFLIDFRMLYFIFASMLMHLEI